MGQKVHPVGFRLGITRTWESRWFENKQYRNWLHDDIQMRRALRDVERQAAISKVEIERRANQVKVIVSTAKPGIIIGKRGAGIEELRKRLERISGKQVSVNVLEIKHPELDARLVANNIVDQLEKRIAFRRAMRQAIQRTMKAGAKGIKVQCGGRLGGAEIARVERNFEGKVPLHTLRANIDYANVEAYTTFGRIGVKVWIYLGEVLPDGKARAETREGRPGRVERRARTPRAKAAAPTAADVVGPTESVPGQASLAPPHVDQGQPAPAADVVGPTESVPGQATLAPPQGEGA